MTYKKFKFDPAIVAAISKLTWPVNKLRPIVEACSPLLKNLEGLQPQFHDAARAKRLADLVLASKKKTINAALSDIQKEIDSGSPLNARQVFFLIMETNGFSVDDGLRLLIEIGRSVKDGGTKGHESAYGTKEKKNKKRREYQDWIDVVARKHPEWSFEAIKKQVAKEQSGRVSIHQLKRYTKDPRKK